VSSQNQDHNTNTHEAVNATAQPARRTKLSGGATAKKSTRPKRTLHY
jgi:hypothetical protein